MAGESIIDPGSLQLAVTGMANEASAGVGRRNAASDQLASDSQRMWSIAMTTPTVNAALGYRAATESGSGRTRSETNGPDSTGAGGAK